MSSGSHPGGATNDYSSPDGFARLAGEFEALRELPPDEREARLARLAVRDPALAVELRALLAHHRDDPDELATPERAFAPTEVEHALRHVGAAPGVPERIGPYHIQRALGHGGMGSVYLGEHEDPDLRRHVAVKVLRSARHHDDDVLARFRTERRILAGLQHPNIAALYDAGTTADGQPFVAMEFVDGSDIVSHCDAAQLPTEARLRLFVKVCRAVAHAHRALVVHRDLKPSNVLVARDGEPKLLDFGIAKLLDDAALDAQPLVTLTGNMMLTPEYSSPEQVRGAAITTSTDVYALGVMLYELLTAARAQQRDNDSMAELLRVVCERTPLPASTAVRRGPDDVPGHPERRTRLSRRLEGDLDTILATAMRKEPERRYGTAAALADDLERHLNGLPVSARPDTFVYRTRKFVARNRLPVFAAALAGLLLVAFAVVTARDNRIIEQQLATIRGQNETIRQERDEAIRQRTVATRIADFQESLFEMAELDPTRAETLRARELLDRGALRIAGELADAPGVRAPLELAMGRAYSSLGLWRDAEPLLLAAEQTFAKLHPNDNDHRLAQFWLGGAYMQLGRTGDGEALIRRSWQPLGDGSELHPVVAAARRAALAGWLRDQGRFDDALAMIATARRLAGGNLPDQLEHGVDLDAVEAGVRRDRGELDDALRLAKAALQRSIAQHGDGHPRQARLHRELAQVHQQLEDLDAARSELLRALELDRKWSGEQHPDVEACLFSLAMIEVDRGDWRAAETRLRDVLQRDQRRFGEQHPYLALTMSQLAMVLGNLGDDSAEQMFLDALVRQRRALPDDHPELATTIANLGSYYNRIGRAEDAAKRFEEALAMRARIYPAEHPIVLTARQQLAVSELERGNAERAEQLFREILALRREVRGEHSETAGSLLSLATCIARQRRPDEAIPLFVESIAMFRATLPTGHATIARPLLGLAIAHLRTSHADEATPLLREAIELREAALGGDHFETLYSRYWLTRSLYAEREFAAARATGEGVTAAWTSPPRAPIRCSSSCRRTPPVGCWWPRTRPSRRRRSKPRRPPRRCCSAASRPAPCSNSQPPPRCAERSARACIACRSTAAKPASWSASAPSASRPPATCARPARCAPRVAPGPRSTNSPSCSRTCRWTRSS